MALVDQKTPRLGLLLPFTDNFLQDDVERLRDTFNLLDVLVVTRDENTGKIADDMLSDVIAKLDAQGKLNKSNLPSTVVQTGPDGKIDGSLMPSIAVVDTFVVPNEASMLGLQCERGDIAIREDLGKTFILTQMPPSVLSNWRELTSTNVTSVNGKTGAVTGLAASGANNDITSLNALSGPLRLGGDAAGDYDAVTLRQLKASSGGSGGASMNGVMNNFIGAVEWFNGSRAKIPAGYIPADGQKVLKTDAPDLWAAVNNNVLTSTNEATWQGNLNKRACYAYDTSTTEFRVPDLNGQQTGSITGVFLRGHSAAAEAQSGTVGEMRVNAAPNINGTISSIASDLSIGTFFSGTGAFKIEARNENRIINPQVVGSSASAWAKFDASLSNAAYGRDSAAEVRPNSAVGIWIIRASGTFSAQNTVFNVLTGDTTAPAVNTIVPGGSINSIYQIAGADAYKAQFYSDNKYGVYNYATISVEDVLNKTNRGTLSVDTNGQVVTSARVTQAGISNGKLTAQLVGQIPNPDIPNLDTCIFYSGDNSAAPNIGKPFNYWMGLNLAEGYHTGSGGNYFQQAFPMAVDAPPKFRIRIANPSARFTNWYSYLAQDTVTKTTQIDAYQGGWGEPKAGRAPLWLKTVSNNSGGFVPALSFGSASGSNGANYPMRTTLGLISRGTTQWPETVLRMDGDGQWYGNYYFAMGGRIYGENANDQNNASQSAWEFQKNALSDEQFKTDIKPYDGKLSLANINALEMKTFRYTIDQMKPDVVRRGIIAQQARQVDPEYVHAVKTPNSVETLTLDSNVLLLDALAAIQVLSARVKQLESAQK